MKIRTHLVMLVSAVLLPVLIFAAVLTGLFWLQQRANFDQRYLDRVRAVSLALDTEIEASIRVLDALEFTSGIDSPELSQFAGKARRVLHGRQMKLVAFTGYGQEEDLQRARLAGFDACLVKPLEPAALERILAAV